MKVLICNRPGEIALADRPKPVPGAGEVLLRIRRVGICGTDLHIFDGTQPFLSYPRVIGHELAGEVADPGTSGLAVGQAVLVIPYLVCGTCHACRRGNTNCCQRISVFGVHQDGGAAEYLAVPQANVLPADGIGLNEAAMVEFLAIGAHAVRRAGISAADRVLVVGAGPIGIGCMIFAGLAGAAITALDMRADRLAFCRDELGVSAAVDAAADPVAALAALTDGDFFDVVIDATGSAKAMAQSLRYVAHGGKLVFVGVVQADIGFSDPEFHKRETTLLASRNATPADFAAVLEHMRAGRIPTAALNNHRVSLADAPASFPAWLDPHGTVIKAIVEL